MTEKQKTRATGAYSVMGQKAKILQSRDKHKLWDNLFHITESQITALKEKIDAGTDLDHKDMQKLDSCFGGLKKLLEIEVQLKSDTIAKLSNEELEKLVRKALRERKASNDQRPKAH